MITTVNMQALFRFGNANVNMNIIRMSSFIVNLCRDDQLIPVLLTYTSFHLVCYFLCLSLWWGGKTLSAHVNRFTWQRCSLTLAAPYINESQMLQRYGNHSQGAAVCPLNYGWCGQSINLRLLANYWLSWDSTSTAVSRDKTKADSELDSWES